MKSEKLIRTCSIWRALDILGDVPVLLLVGAAFMGRRRFEEFEKTTLLQKTILSDRLHLLVDAGIFRRHAYSERSQRQEYRLTRMGVALHPVCLSFLTWQAKWDASSEANYRIGLKHRDCGCDTTPVAVRHLERTPYAANECVWEDGPGQGWILANHRRRRRQAEAVSLRQAETIFPLRINAIIGDRWSALLIRALFCGFTRYDDLLEQTRASTNVLSERLSGLVAKGLVTRSSAEYRLTSAGLDIFPTMVELMRWGDSWRAAPEGPPVILRDQTTGAALEPDMACSACGGSLTVSNLDFREEPRRRAA